MYKELENKIFSISSELGFTDAALAIFQFQYLNNPVYRNYCDAIGSKPGTINTIEEIPFLPITFFKNREVLTRRRQPEGRESEVIFLSSATTSGTPSKHIVSDLNLYRESFRRTFAYFYGDIRDYCILALLPSYLERSASSLVFMTDDLIRQSAHPGSGFYINNFSDLNKKLLSLEQKGQKTILLGVTYALLAFAEDYPLPLNHTIVMETGGMKGKREELPRAGVHELLKAAFNLNAIHSEYGMTELLSQSYSKGDGIFRSPPWMRISVRDRYDPLKTGLINIAGGINIIDLANINSCPFIAAEDAGIVHQDGSFEITGRLDASEVRGCNLMFEE